ncbi:DUF3858 domain-containing protein [Flavobacterium lindanitolerans]|uniref:DUF3858 domain-containing protein n=1 Tax=Flavobacterium lindanitolerans TaxID=428988 RepID=UPI00280783E3|nr:DUF3858 domain-containing protein [Flavobacterium lindanitolerans]MDQ7960760.1 DUF3858 domain-containing protein [Flavobacterium lindanitolerans]
MKKNIFTICFVLFALNLFAQKKYELGKVTVEELKEKVHPKDTSAVAAILFKKGNTYLDYDMDGNWVAVTEVATKIKIYKKEGYEFANEQIPYYTGGKQIRLFFDDAVTYNLVGDKVEKTKLKSDGEFTERVNEIFSVKKITMPNVKEGSVIEYKYTIRTPYLTSLNDWYFQYPIPADYVEYKIAIPQYFNYSVFMKGYLKVNKKPSVVASAAAKKFNELVTVYTIENVKALKEESYVNNIDNYRSMLQFELASTDFPNQGLKNYAADWASVTKNIYEHKDFGDELNYKSYFEKDIEPIIKGVTSREEKIKLIFDYVKTRMNWNEKNSYYCNVGVKKAYAEKVGNVAEINLMLVAMLRYAELKANPVLISTRSNGIAVYPAPSAYNYVIAGVELDNNQQILLDATSKNALPNILPFRALNWLGRMIRNDKTSIEVDLAPKSNSKEVVNVIAAIDEEGKVEGKIRAQYFDYNAYGFREIHLKTSKDKYLEEMEKRYGGVEVGEYTTTNDNDLSKPIIETFSFVNNNLADRIGNKIYFSPMLHYARHENPFKDEVREFPVDFMFPYQDKYSYTITIPKGYEVESMPEPIAIYMESNIGSFKYNIIKTANQVQVTTILDMNYSNIPPDYYHTLRDFYKKMLEKQNEKVVLKKV